MLFIFAGHCWTIRPPKRTILDKFGHEMDNFGVQENINLLLINDL